MKRPLKNMAASVRQRLLNKAREINRGFPLPGADSGRLGGRSFF